MDLHAPLVVHGYESHAPLLEVEGLDPHSPQKVLIHAPIQGQEMMNEHRNGGHRFDSRRGTNAVTRDFRGLRAIFAFFVLPEDIPPIPTEFYLRMR
ncbi:hypothetical protein KGM_214472 [Danaus plexippus plexippus]|uniref:Uncharacterized protein n=1 Tax=Danaus plexippus plexippus TaxID=278856 RepID=A0A212ELT6_DANPL|nr:hypothetical protein KGM_214472 [Danaus plexippus plexippus]